MTRREKITSRSLGIFLLCLSTISCASQSVMLVHPQSGTIIRCGAAGVGIMAGSAVSLVDECLKQYEAQGYLPVENLTLEQRADLERRGVLPKPEPPTFRMGY